MSERVRIIGAVYENYDEDARLRQSRQGQMEYAATMAYIRRYVKPGAKILEIGAGTGRYSIALAKEGYGVTAVELVEKNLNELKANGAGLDNLHAYQGDALDLSRFEDGAFDITLSFGPMYHLYDRGDVRCALEEAVRVTKRGGIMMFAFLSVYAIIWNNYLNGTLLEGIEENFTDGYAVRHFEEQVFTGYDIAEFEALFAGFPVEHVTTAAQDGILELACRRSDFAMSDEEFEAFAKLHMATCEKRELLGSSSHLLYIGRKK